MIDKLAQKQARFQKRRLRSKKHLRVSSDRPRMVVHRSNRYLYVQVIDDHAGKVIVSFSSISKALDGKKLSKSIESAKLIGEKVGEMLQAAQVDKVVFDRNGLLYHGKVQALAEACRSKGIQF